MTQKQLFFGFKDGQFVNLNDDKKSMFSNVSDFVKTKLFGKEKKRQLHSSFLKSENTMYYMKEIPEGDLVISFRKEKNDIAVYFWSDNYSIGMTHTELMAVLKLIKDKDELMQMIVAEAI